MIPADLKFLNSKESIPSDISILDNFDAELLRKFWKGESSRSEGERTCN